MSILVTDATPGESDDGGGDDGVCGVVGVCNGFGAVGGVAGFCWGVVYADGDGGGSGIIGIRGWRGRRR